MLEHQLVSCIFDITARQLKYMQCSVDPSFRWYHILDHYATLYIDNNTLYIGVLVKL